GPQLVDAVGRGGFFPRPARGNDRIEARPQFGQARAISGPGCGDVLAPMPPGELNDLAQARQRAALPADAARRGATGVDEVNAFCEGLKLIWAECHVLPCRLGTYAEEVTAPYKSTALTGNDG